jgi:hypothetical protein
MIAVIIVVVVVVADDDKVLAVPSIDYAQRAQLHVHG